MNEKAPEQMDEWDEYEEAGPQDLEDALDAALDRSFPLSPGEKP